MNDLQAVRSGVPVLTGAASLRPISPHAPSRWSASATRSLTEVGASCEVRRWPPARPGVKLFETWPVSGQYRSGKEV